MFLQKIKSWFGVKKTTEQPKEELLKTGVIKYFNRSRGYGFIRSKQTKKDVYVHISDAKNHLKVGAKVNFRVEETEKGLRALEVMLAR